MEQLGSTILDKETFAWYQIPAMEVFPVSLSMIHMAGLEKQLSEVTISRLKGIEDDLRKKAKIASILQAPTDDDLAAALVKGYAVAIDYYVESGVVLWRSLGHNYEKLLSLSQVSCQVIEDIFFKNAKRLDPNIFTKSVAALRAIREVGKRITLAETHSSIENQTPPIKYLTQVMLSTFILWCLLAFVKGEVRKAQRSNLKALSDLLFSYAKEVYQEALERGLFKTEAEISFWNPDWQEGEVEVDLDKQSGRVKSFNNINDLIDDLDSP